MYDPTVGRWLNLDPLGFDAGDANPTRYIGNGPTNATDPSGLQPPWFSVLPGPSPSEPVLPGSSLREVMQVVNWHLNSAPAGAQALTFVSANTATAVNPWRPANMQIPVIKDLADLEQQLSGTTTLAALEIIGHAREQQGVSIGNNVINDQNVGLFIAALKRMPFDRDPNTGKLKGLLILTSCCAGCYTYLDGSGLGISLVKRIAIETGLTVLSPGGFAGNGSFLHTTRNADPDTSDRYLGRTLHQRRGYYTRAYPSRNNIWFITQPE